MFTPQQVKQFKEAFNMIDQDGDGRVTEEDLKVMLSNLGESKVELYLCDHVRRHHILVFTNPQTTISSTAA